RAERSFLRENGIPTAGLHVVDGSGLAHSNRVSAETLAGILYRWKSGPASLYPLLPRGGKDGTLKSYHFDAAAGRVRAKSGHLDDVGALAGYVATRHHGRVIFAMIIDASRYDTDAPIVAAIDALSAY
nr:D-alanyl-D-alanine carboxypeptidase [Candidatus Eremiobacteraeota bacterium]